MTLHEFKSWFKFIGKAKNRHGVHSPFVYTFNEDVLNYSRSQEELVSNMAYYYSIGKIEGIDIKGAAPRIKTKSAMTFNRLIVRELANNQATDQWLNELGEDDMLIVKPLYSNQDTQSLWERLYKNDKVRLSVDMFGAGLLLSRKEFKVKQHFLLRSSL